MSKRTLTQLAVINVASMRQLENELLCYSNLPTEVICIIISWIKKVRQAGKDSLPWKLVNMFVNMFCYFSLGNLKLKREHFCLDDYDLSISFPHVQLDLDQNVVVFAVGMSKVITISRCTKQIINEFEIPENSTGFYIDNEEECIYITTLFSQVRKYDTDGKLLAVINVDFGTTIPKSYSKCCILPKTKNFVFVESTYQICVICDKHGKLVKRCEVDGVPIPCTSSLPRHSPLCVDPTSGNFCFSLDYYNYSRKSMREAHIFSEDGEYIKSFYLCNSPVSAMAFDATGNLVAFSDKGIYVFEKKLTRVMKLEHSKSAFSGVVDFNGNIVCTFNNKIGVFGVLDINATE